MVDIFKRYANGEKVSEIVKILQNKGFKTQLGKEPSNSFVMHLLENRRYLGEYRYQDTVINDAFDPIITPQLFDKCQTRRLANKRKSASFKSAVKEKYILSDKMCCGLCGMNMAGESGKSSTGKIHRYYKCRNAKKFKTCDKKAINKQLVEDLVFSYTFAILSDKKLINRIVDSVFELQTRQTALPKLQEQMKQIETEIANIMSAIKAGIITKSTKSELENLEQEQERLELAITKESIQRPLITKEQMKFWIMKFKDMNIDDEDEKQSLINTFVNSIYVYDDKMVITFNYKDGEKLVGFDDVTSALEKQNADNHNDCQRSTIKSVGDS